MISSHTGNVGLDQDLDVVSRLKDVNTVEEGDQTHSLERECEEVINMTEDDVGDKFSGDGSSKIVHLTAEQYPFVLYKTGVQTGLMDGQLEGERADDRVGVMFPQAGGFRVSLKCTKTRDDFTG